MATRSGILGRFIEGRFGRARQQDNAVERLNDRKVVWPADPVREPEDVLRRNRDFKVYPRDLAGKLERAHDEVLAVQSQITPAEAQKIIFDIFDVISRRAPIGSAEKVIADELFRALKTAEKDKAFDVEKLYEVFGDVQRRVVDEFTSPMNQVIRHDMTKLASPVQRLDKLSAGVQAQRLNKEIPIETLTEIRLKVRDLGASLSTKEGVLGAVRDNLRKVTWDLVRVVKESGLPY